MDLHTAAAELYVALPADFVETRTRLAKEARADGDRELAKAIGALPKPTLAAWAVNLLARTHGEEVRRLLAVGTRLREAQAAGAVEDLRGLNRTQHELLAAVRRRAEAVARRAGQPLSEPVAQRVQATLHAGMADPWAAAAVRSGLLVTDLASTGFGSVDLSGAIAVPDVRVPTDAHLRDATPGPHSPGPHPSGTAVGPAAGTGRDVDRQKAARRADADAPRRTADADARRRAEGLAADAEAVADEARSRLEDADAALEDLAREAAERDEEIAALTARLRELRAAQTSAGVRERRALAARKQAAHALKVAEKAADEARAAVPDPSA